MIDSSSVPSFNLRVDADVEPLADGDVARGECRKAGKLDVDLIGARQQVRHVVAAGLVRDDVARQVRFALRDGDRRAGKRRPGFVGDVAEQRAIQRLAPQRPPPPTPTPPGAELSTKSSYFLQKTDS